MPHTSANIEPDRRTFLQRLAAASALLAGATPAVAAVASAQQPSDPWLAKVTAKHRQVFDATSPNSGFAPIFAANYIRTMTETYKLAPGGVHAIVVFRHFAMPLALKDEVWAKYNIGAMIGVTDPKTKAPSKRNIFWMPGEGDVFFPALSIEKVMQMPTTFVACAAALAVLSGMAAQGAGVDAETAKREWEAGLIPGIPTVPSGVLAVARAQEQGCSYCYAG